MNKEQFAEALSARGIELSERQREQFDGYYRLLVEWNEKMNLTAITEEEQVYNKHFYDSITPAFYFPFDQVEKVADIGGGAGFPSIPLKIVFPHLHMTIIDSLNKRMNFLQHVADELGLENLYPVHGRAEDRGQEPQYRQAFDLVVARAVARLNVLSEYCLPFARVGGHFIALKGADISPELNEAKKAIKTLGGKTKQVETFQLMEDAGERNIVIMEKVENTPKGYPRKAGTPAKKPLI
ncbi:MULTISPECIES: 16S rRNA (guanine(527)-N(7))-methyltransferase RsmG [Brevibacillus]|jgi:16S rRNA (guanine527-N7)-methyltransferase|uniref:Ribosomal RNA small subunit methyltransferase G n=1 Tax=Brevibacillus borstelensis AK1 TaxID=1300222 RepID=M8DGT2_9BACL|nr:16S rRNA (guanine(527)-N(7))-methyltransferase RsmG [Brevibacillus borstelensis]EMT52688.1 ribosomal RNA small subunit methyltransferase G [Brevibacillus borstelensis AK1]KKX55041.1 16S rRNA methyltransferase [Brevibacillus borstelensis cifa_chp40]MBE5393819.1 16S rRNA (guanine(527)-N(7))-methyltransferase RsmG [Brevibacillus borstelensis]MCC0566729.1 16S rRNA (guanine(527)-N(7))-methyltransferase RsmG [Brevibacillus borstelensis]MCM3473171.1 16S rRNA (guanine(527)-N(7))-methyltransferase R